MTSSDSMDKLFETMKTPLRREIFDYIEENSKSDLSEIYSGVHHFYERDFEGPLDIESELEEMPYVMKNLEQPSPTYGLLDVAEQGVEALEIAMEGEIHYDPGELIRGFEALAELDMVKLESVLEGVTENIQEK